MTVPELAPLVPSGPPISPSRVMSVAQLTESSQTAPNTAGSSNTSTSEGTVSPNSPNSVTSVSESGSDGEETLKSAKMPGIQSIKAEVSTETKLEESAEPEPKPKPKKKKRNRALESLLADSDWYVTQLTPTGKERESSLKIERLKERQQTEQPVLVRPKKVYTPEEVARNKARREARKQKQEQKKEEQRKRQLELKRRRENGELPPPKKARSSKGDDDHAYYRGSEMDQLLRATEFFTHVGGEDFDDSSKREVKPVVRYAPDTTRSSRSSSSVKVKTLKKPGMNVAEKKPKVKAEPKSTTSSKKSTPRGSRASSAAPRSATPSTVKKEKEKPAGPKLTRKQKQALKHEKEEEAIWFTNVQNQRMNVIEEGRQMFLDRIYEGKNVGSVMEGMVQAKDVIMENTKRYHLPDPAVSPTEVWLEAPFSDDRECYMLGFPKEEGLLSPYDDIGRYMEMIAMTFMPPEERIKVINVNAQKTCLVGRYISNFEAQNFAGFKAVLDEFNSLVRTLRASGSMLRFTAQRKDFPSETLTFMYDACYARIVKPYSKKLTTYKAFSNYVYGELLPPFLTMTFQQCGLTKDSHFIDLGSGVGNCVIQAALEYGCSSAGVEIAKAASDMADQQLVEFEKRCDLFGLRPGPIKLFSRQSFVDNPEVKAVVDQCDVILANNYLFNAELNGTLEVLFKDLKVGTKIISLKPIVPPGYTVTWDNPDSILGRLRTTKHVYGADSVSWTVAGGAYYISEVMGDIVDDNFVVFQSRSRRHQQLGEPRSRSSTPLNAFTNNV